MVNFRCEKTSVLFIALLFVSLASVAQSNNVEETVLSTGDRTYVSFGQGLGNYKTPYGIRNLTPILFEGQISPDFYVSLSKIKPIGLTFFPKIVIRMFNEKSYPVKTPSYMPSLLFYHSVNWPFTRQIFHLFKSEQQLAFMTYRLTHHSNGQAASYYLPGTDSINYTNGNFSANSFEVAFSWSVIDSGAIGKAFTNGRIAYEHQLEIEREKKLHDSYYYDKLSIEGHIIYSQMIKAYIIYSYMWGTNNFKPRQAVDVFMVMKPSQRLTDFSLFIRGYFGPDYYNLYYENSLRSITVGIISDPMLIPFLKKAQKRRKQET